MFFFFGGKNLPPSMRRFLRGLMIGSVILFLVGLVIPWIAYAWTFLAGVVFLFALWYAVQNPTARRSINQMRAERGTAEREYREYQREPLAYTRPQPRTDISQEQAQLAREASDRALRAAGLDPASVRLGLHDIGLMVYRGKTTPANVARTESIRDDASHIRPFMRLQSPLPKALDQPISFELTNEQGDIRFKSTESYSVRPGENLITPRTWLPLQDSHQTHGTPAGNWSLTIRIGETVYAVHSFHWRVVPPNVASASQVELNSDGELAETGASARLSGNRPLSLEELLAEQDDAPPQQLRDKKGK